MWEVPEECKEMLTRWSDSSSSSEVKETVDRWLKAEPLLLESDEILNVLRPIANEVPVYPFLERLKLYKPPIKKVINPEYQKRIQKLKWDQENREYELMIRSIDPKQRFGASGLMNFGEEMKAMNRQSVVVFNTILTVGGAFSFGFFGIGYAYPTLNLNIASRMIIGLVLATIVFFADLYFIIKGMDMNQEIDASKHEAPKSNRNVPSTACENATGSEARQHARLLSLKEVRREDLGSSILYCASDTDGFATPHETLARRVFITKILSLSSSGLGIAMLPVITNYLWDSAVDCPPMMAVVVVANAVLSLMSLTPFLLQFLVKRFILNIYYNPETKIFTTVHYGFWTNKKVLRFSAEDVVDAAVAPELKKLWLPLATIFVYGRPLLVSLNADAYKNKEAFRILTKNVKIPSNAD